MASFPDTFIPDVVSHPPVVSSPPDGIALFEPAAESRCSAPCAQAGSLQQIWYVGVDLEFQ